MVSSTTQIDRHTDRRDKQVLVRDMCTDLNYSVCSIHFLARPGWPVDFFGMAWIILLTLHQLDFHYQDFQSWLLAGRTNGLYQPVCKRCIRADIRRLYDSVSYRVVSCPERNAVHWSTDGFVWRRKFCWNRCTRHQGRMSSVLSSHKMPSLTANLSTMYANQGFSAATRIITVWIFILQQLLGSAMNTHYHVMDFIGCRK